MAQGLERIALLLERSNELREEVNRIAWQVAKAQGINLGEDGDEAEGSRKRKPLESPVQVRDGEKKWQIVSWLRIESEDEEDQINENVETAGKEAERVEGNEKGNEKGNDDGSDMDMEE